jgi:DNA polymerase-1
VRDILFRMERTGVLIDSQLLTQQSHEIGKRLLELEARAHAAAGQPFNVNSPKQLAEILFDKLGLPVKKKTPSGTPSTDEEVLSELALDYPLPKILLESRQLAKLKGTYTDKLPKMVNAGTGRVHTSYAQAVAVTGRLASSDPNLQNIPVRTAEGRRIRAAFIAPPGSHIVSADYSQIELRIMAHLSEDARLLEAFAQGEDVHRATAAEIFGVTRRGRSRSAARRQGHQLRPDLRHERLSASRASSTSNAAPRRPTSSAISRATPASPLHGEHARDGPDAGLRRNRFRPSPVAARDPFEPGRPSPGRRTGGDQRADAGFGGRSDQVGDDRRAGLARRRALQTRLLMQVHDELVLEVPDDELARVRDELPRLMTELARLRVPLVVDVGVGANWDEAH